MNSLQILNFLIILLPHLHYFLETYVCSYPGEADRFREAVNSSAHGIECQNDIGPNVYGTPKLITDDPAKTVQDGTVDVVIMALPSLFHATYLEALKPYLKPGVIIGAMPGQAGFDLAVRHCLGDDFCSASSLFSLETLPWACRILEYGKVVEVLGTKKETDVVIAPKLGDTIQPVLDLLQKLIGAAPILKPAGNFLAVTLMNINSVWHPTISYSYYHDKDLKAYMDEPPLFYYGATEFTGEMLDMVSNEVLEVKRVLLEKYPGLDLSSLTHVRDWMVRSYGDDIGDTSTLHRMLITNKGYRGLTHPTLVVEVNGTKKYLPNFNYRYFSEDLPCGLLVTRGIAELVGVSTPQMDKVLEWAQTGMKKEFLVDGKLQGKDVATTRAPQRYGFKDLDTFMHANYYV